MSDSSWCPTCGEFMIWPDSHKCPPRWEIKHPDWLGEETQIVYGRDAEAAGAKYAARHDSFGDYEIIGGLEITVQIRKAGTVTEEPGSWGTYILSGETVAEYHARLI